MRLHVTKTELIEKETDFDVIIPDGTPEDEIKQIPDPEFQGVDWLAVRPLVQNAPTITRPGPVD